MSPRKRLATDPRTKGTHPSMWNAYGSPSTVGVEAYTYHPYSWNSRYSNPQSKWWADDDYQSREFQSPFMWYYYPQQNM